MEDNNLYTFFKSRKHMFDEAPGDVLWAKIETNLDIPATSSGKGFSFKTLLFLVTALFVIGITWLVVFNDEANERPATSARENKHEKIETKPILVPEIVKTPNAVITTEAIPITAVESKIIVIEKDTVKKKKPYVAFQKITGKTTAINKDSTPFDINNVETTVSRANGRVTVNTKEKLTPPQFQQLIEKVLKENEQAVGTLVTIKAPGHKVFRQVIKPLITEPVLKSPNTIPIQKQYVDHVKFIPEKDSLQTKLESLSIEPAYLDFKPIDEKLKQ